MAFLQKRALFYALSIHTPWVTSSKLYCKVPVAGIISSVSTMLALLSFYVEWCSIAARRLCRNINLHFPRSWLLSGWGFFKFMMQRFKIIIAYDGSDFDGWQVQLHEKTVANRLQQIFYKVFGRHVSLIGASRTDTNVHALGQVATFETDLNLAPEHLMSAWNNALPDSILIRSIEPVAANFHPHRGVQKKVYYYHLFTRPPLPFVARYGWYYQFMPQIDLEKFYHALALYEGEHDFRSFCKLEEERSTVRTIDKVAVHHYARYGVLRVVIEGKAFLRFQIRRMIGYGLDVARRPELSLAYLQDILDNPHPEQTLLRADGKGLCLRRILYKPSS